MKLINIGYGNLVNSAKVVSVVSPDAAPIKRLMQDARDAGKLIDASSGKKGWKSRLMTWVRANVFIPDARMLWIRPSVRRLNKILREEGIDTLFSTGPPHSTLLIAL